MDPVAAQRGGLRLLVHDVVGVLAEARDHPVDAAVEIGRLGAGSREDEGRSRLVHEEAVRLVHDGVVQISQHQPVGVLHRVVTEVVETHLRVGRVGDIAGVGVSPLLAAHVVLDCADGEAQGLVDRGHPVPVSLSEVVVVGEQMSSLALQGVEIEGRHRDLRLSLPGPHLGNPAPVEHDGAHHLHVEVRHEVLPVIAQRIRPQLLFEALRLRQGHYRILRRHPLVAVDAEPDLAVPELPPGGLTHQGIGLDHEVVERLSPGQPVPKLVGLGPHLLVAELAHVRAKRVDPFDQAARSTQIASRRIEDRGEYGHW